MRQNLTYFVFNCVICVISLYFTFNNNILPLKYISLPFEMCIFVCKSHVLVA